MHVMHNSAMTELAERMDKQGLTDAKLAEMVGRHRSSINRLKRGLNCNISLEHATAISRITGIAVEALLASPKAKGEA